MADTTNPTSAATARVRKLVRQTDILDSLDLFSKRDDPTRTVEIAQVDRVDKVLGRIRLGLQEALKTQSTLYGWHVQAMFRELVAALGTINLLKEEDVGDCYFQGAPIKVPDYR